MKVHKVISNAALWVPVSVRKCWFGDALQHQKGVMRSPLLWLYRDDNDLYLVNDSGETLTKVIADCAGFQTVDDDVLTTNSIEPYCYEAVLPNTAVKVEEYDGFYDLDYMLQVYLTIQSPALGHVEFVTPKAKGGISDTVLLWQMGETGKGVTLKYL